MISFDIGISMDDLRSLPKELRRPHFKDEGSLND